jgi:LacI family transcriptional regulator
MLSLVLPPHAEITGYTASIIAGLGDVCRDAGYELSATPDIPHLDELAVVKSIVQNQRADGIVLSRTSPQDLRVRYLLEHNFPFVSHGRTELASAHASVDFDNEQFAVLATNRLAKRGRQRLMLVGVSPSLTYQTHLLNGFRRAITRNNLQYVEPPEPLSLEMPLTKLRDIIHTLYASGNGPDGIVCVGDIASLAIMAGIQDAGYTPAADVDIISKQTSATLDHVVPAIDSYFEDIVLTGRRLGDTLLDVISGETPLEQLNILIQPEPRLRLG